MVYTNRMSFAAETAADMDWMHIIPLILQKRMGIYEDDGIAFALFALVKGALPSLRTFLDRSKSSLHDMTARLAKDPACVQGGLCPRGTAGQSDAVQPSVGVGKR